MKKFFSQDSIISALTAGLGSMLLYCLLLWIGLKVAGEPVSNHVRWFGGAFIPLILVLRAYSKSKRHLVATKTIIILFFITFVAFMAYLLASHTITFK